MIEHRSEYGVIYQGDCLEVLKTLPDASVHCCVTSPPYFGLRDYGVDGQIGLESCPEEYIEMMVVVFREVKRVLRDDGLCFLNIGDSYASGGRKSRAADGKCRARGMEYRPASPKLKPKELIGIPWMLAFALRADGWLVRQEIIWAKGVSFCDAYSGSAMPESVKDRFTKSHEHIFMLAKQEKYYFDQDDVKEPAVCGAHGSEFHTGKTGIHQLGRSQKVRPSMPKGAFQAKGEPLPGQLPFRAVEEYRNPRSVWCISPRGFKEAHFATFPERLVKPCIKAGTSEKGCCLECGAPWERITKRKGMTAHDGKTNSAYGKGSTANRLALLRQAARERGEEYRNQTETIGWRPLCSCGATETEPCTVLDPFFGAGTAGLVAAKLGRYFIGIELNPDYIEIARKRIEAAIPKQTRMAL